MARANPHARKLLAAVVAPVVEAHGGAPKVSEKVGRHRSTVTRWVKGDIDWDGLTALASGLRTDIVVTFPAHGHPSATTKEPPPEWARELQAKVDAIHAKVMDDETTASGELEAGIEAAHRAVREQESGQPLPDATRRPKDPRPRGTG